MNTFLNIKRDTVFLIIIIVGFLLTVLAFGALYFAVPDPLVFNSAVEKIFVENDFTQQTDLKLLEVLAQSGSLFEGSIALYSKIIFTLFFVVLTVMMICFAFIFSLRVSSIIERIDLGCASNPMRVLISLTAPLFGLSLRRSGLIENL